MPHQRSSGPAPAHAGAFRAGDFLLNLGLVLASLAVAALILEAALRLWSPGHLKLFPRYHEAVSYGTYTLRRTRPNTAFVHTSVDGSWRFKVNAQGFRSPMPYTYARRPGIARVLVLGDSQAFGYENDHSDILPVRLEAHLRERGVEAEVVNTGVSGFGNAEEVVFLEQEGIRYAPDLVVLLFFKNDYQDNVRAGLFETRGGALAEANHIYAPGTGILRVINSSGAVRWLSERSFLYSFVFNTVWNIAKNISIAGAEADTFERTSGVGVVPAHQKELTILILERMRRFLGERSIPLAIVDVPDVSPSGDVRDFERSIAPDQADRFADLSDVIVLSEAVLGPYRGREAFHRPHGDRHVTAFVHETLARQLATQVAPLLSRRAGSGTTDADGRPARD
jgi:hypothetical protein